MYCPASFQTTREEDLALIKSFPLATVVTCDPSIGFVAHSLPLFVSSSNDDSLVLRGHFARKNPLLELLRYGADCLIVFHGESHYISPSFMGTKDSVVPTYNYSNVQCQGFATLREDVAFVREVVTLLTNQEESKHVPNNPWRVDPDDVFVERRLAEIVGLEIVCSAVKGKNKNSQNKSEAMRKSIASHISKDANMYPATTTAAVTLAAALLAGVLVYFAVKKE
jgi:transcriptional regulator